MRARQTTLWLLLIGLIFTGLFVGAADLSVAAVWRGLLSGFGVSGPDDLAQAVVMGIRLPRVIGGVLVGGALGIAGAGLQGVVRNELADPYILGISSGAGLGLITGTLLSEAGSIPLVQVLAASAAGAIVAILIRRWVGLAGFADGLLLIGVALTFVFLSWTLLITFAIDSPRLPTFAYFVFGGLGTLTWSLIWVGIPFIVLSTLILIMNRRSLDLISLGDDDALSLGVDVPRVTGSVLAAVGVAVGASVAMAGVIGFVGLVGPMLARRWFGAAHRVLLPAAALIGASFVLACDISIRALVDQVEVPLGVVTAALGGPMLLIVLLRRRSA